MTTSSTARAAAPTRPTSPSFATGQLGQFYDVQGTGWKDPPLLASPTQTVRAAGRELSLYYQSSQLEMVAWHDHGASYWVRNSLTQALSDGEMLAIAEQTRPLSAGLAPGQGRRVNLRGARVHFGAPPSQPTDVRQTIGAAAGLASLVAIALLAVLTFRRRRSVAELRAELEAHVQREGQLHEKLTRRTRPVPRPR